MQKPWVVEVVRCINEWGNGAWDANEIRWKNPCTTEWMSRWTNEMQTMAVVHNSEVFLAQLLLTIGLATTIGLVLVVVGQDLLVIDTPLPVEEPAGGPSGGWWSTVSRWEVFVAGASPLGDCSAPQQNKDTLRVQPTDSIELVDRWSTVVWWVQIKKQKGAWGLALYHRDALNLDWDMVSNDFFPSPFSRISFVYQFLLDGSQSPSSHAIEIQQAVTWLTSPEVVVGGGMGQTS